MNRVLITNVASLACLALLVARASESGPAAPGLQAMASANSEWSAPVNLGATINSTFIDAQPNLSKDGLSLYFTSNRPAGGQGGNDIWVARRAKCRSEEHTSELQSQFHLVCRLLLEKKKLS